MNNIFIKKILFSGIVLISLLSSDKLFCMEEKRQRKQLVRANSFPSFRVLNDQNRLENMQADLDKMTQLYRKVKRDNIETRALCLELKQMSNENRKLFLNLKKANREIRQEFAEATKQIAGLKALYELQQFQMGVLERTLTTEEKPKKKKKKNTQSVARKKSKKKKKYSEGSRYAHTMKRDSAACAKIDSLNEDLQVQMKGSNSSQEDFLPSISQKKTT